MKTFLKTIYTAAAMAVGAVVVWSAIAALYLSLFWDLETAWVRVQALAVTTCIIYGAMDISKGLADWVQSIWENKQ